MLPQAKIPDHPFMAEQLLAEMTRARVGRAVLVQPSLYGWDRRYLLEVLEAHPDRFKGVVLADPADPEIERRLTDLASAAGVRGVRFHLLDALQEDIFNSASERIALTSQSYPFEACWPLTRKVVHRFGSHRVMWGSNCPHSFSSGAYRELAEVVDICRAELSSADRERIG